MNDETELQKPDWEYWRDRGAATLPEAVLLSLDVEPRQKLGLHFYGQGDGAYEEMSKMNRDFVRHALDDRKPGLGQLFTDRLSMAESQIPTGVKSWR